MNAFSAAIKKFPDRFANGLALAAGLVYAIQVWIYIHMQMSVLDEGLYLYKGWLFATGRYIPFQDYGPWTNHMPLSFLIPGWFQGLLGPGIFAGRMLALLSGLLVLLGLWILARRFGGRWWAAAAVWVLALNPAIIKMYSVQASQVLAASILVWALVLLLGEDRSDWQLVLGSALAGALALTRLNLAPVLPLAILYVFWQHGRRRGLIALASGGLVFAVGHAVYWPGILRMYAPWFPERLTPFLDAFRRPPNDGAAWTPVVDSSRRVVSFLQGLRFHFVPLMAVLTTLLAFPARKILREHRHRKVLVFLLVLFVVLFASHAAAALGKSYCVFCFSTYLSFFSMTGVLVLIIALPILDGNRVFARGAWWILLLIMIFAGFSTYNTIGVSVLPETSLVRFLKTEIPRLSGAGQFPIWGFIENLTGKDYTSQVTLTLTTLRIALGGMLGLIIMLVVGWLARRWTAGGASRQMRVIHVFLAAAMLLSPTAFLSGSYRSYDCEGDVIAAYEAAGAYLAERSPAGARIFWQTYASPVPLLYIPDAQVFPQQLNGFYSLKNGGEPDSLARFGHWNRALAEQWASEADVILLSPSVYHEADQAWLISYAEGEDFIEYPATNPVHPCNPESRIVVFVRELNSDE